MNSTKTLIKCFKEGCMSTAALEGIHKSLVDECCEEVSRFMSQLECGLHIIEDLLSSTKYLLQHNSTCFTHLKQAGFLSCLSLVCKQTCLRVSHEGSSTDELQKLVELITTTTNIWANTNTAAKACVVEEVGPYILDLMQHSSLVFQTRLEVLKSTNRLLEQCPIQAKENFLNNEANANRINGLVQLVNTVGDYEFQVAVVECLMRLFPRKLRQSFASKFITDELLCTGFVAIQDKDFEIDCRLFLNNVNSRADDPTKGVFSLPCMTAFVGSKELQKPSDPGYEVFWVDFNIGSERMTLFCEQDSLCSEALSGFLPLLASVHCKQLIVFHEYLTLDSQHSAMEGELWETVAIYKTDVQKYSYIERDGVITLEICLTSPVCDIYPSQHQDVTDNKINIQFNAELEDHINHAVGYTFNFAEKRRKVSTVSTPIQISVKEVQEADSLSQMSQAEEAYNTRCKDDVASNKGSQESTARKHKVSVPCISLGSMQPQKGVKQHHTNIEKGRKTENQHKRKSAIQNDNEPEHVDKTNGSDTRVIMNSTQKLIKIFEESCMSPSAVNAINKGLLDKCCKEIGSYMDKLNGDVSVIEDLMNTIQYLTKHNASCFTHLKHHGLIRLFSLVLQKIIQRLSHDGCSETKKAVLELTLESVIMVADVTSSAGSSLVDEVGPLLFDLVQQHSLGFQTRLEILKSINLLLDQCSVEVKEKILNTTDNAEKIGCLVEMVKTVGDYEFQVTLVECFMRLFPRKMRQTFASKFIRDEQMCEGFMAIKDQAFETDCRLFLNSVNSRSIDPTKGVFSLPCAAALIGNKELQKPPDPGYEVFWVDFNIGSERLTLFCAQDGLGSQHSAMDAELWEMVAIYKTDVQKYDMIEKDGVITLEIRLTSPVCDIYPSQHQDVTDNKINIQFSAELEDHINHAVAYTFDLAESAAQSTKSPTCGNKVEPKPAVKGSMDLGVKMQKVSVPCISISAQQKQSETKVKTEEVLEPVKRKEKNHLKQKIVKSVQEEVEKVTIPESQDVIQAYTKTLQDSAKKKKPNKTAKDQNQNEISTPKTPVLGKRTRSKVKVKTPVVMVLAPNKKSSKQSDNKQLAKNSKPAEQMENENGLQKDPTPEVDLVIPESLPSVAEKDDDKRDRLRSDDNLLDDSGLGKDISRLTFQSDISCLEAPAKTSINPKEVVSKQKKGRLSKKKSKHEPRTEKDVLKEVCDHSESTGKITEQDIETNNEKGNTQVLLTSREDVQDKIEACNDTIEDLGFDMCNDIEKGNCKVLLESTEDKQDKLEACNDTSDNFGFDSLCNDETIPDSFDEITSDTNDKKEINISSCPAENTSKHKRLKDSKKDSTEHDSHSNEIEVANGKSELGKANKNKKKFNYKLDDKQDKKSFCDIDNSLKELCELDKKQSDQVAKNAKKKQLSKDKNGKQKQSEKCVNQDKASQEELDGLYTLSEPDVGLKDSGSATCCVKEQLQGDISKNEKETQNCNKKMIETKDKTKKKTKKKASKTDHKDVKIEKNKDQPKFETKLKDSDSRSRSLRSRKPQKGKKQVDESIDIEEVDSSPVESKTSSDDTNLGGEISPDINLGGEMSPDIPVQETMDSNMCRSHRPAVVEAKYIATVVIEDCLKSRRKSRVSFDLPNSQSSQGSVCNSEEVNPKQKNTKRKEMCKSNSKKNAVSDGVPAVVIDEDNDPDGTSSIHNLCNQDKTEDTKSKVKKKSTLNEGNQLCNVPVAHVNPMITSSDINTPASSDSDDDLYIESDDSYNARRYRLEVAGFPKSSRRKRKSSIKGTTSNDSGTKKTDLETVNKQTENNSNSKEKNKNAKRKSLPVLSKTYEEQTCGLENNFVEKDSINKFSRCNSFSTENFEDMECDQMASAIQKQNMPIVDSTQTVFQMSYSNAKTSKVVGNKMKRLSEKYSRKEKSYDPYDFEAQIDNASTQSERTKRQDMSKCLNQKQKIKREKANNSPCDQDVSQKDKREKRFKNTKVNSEIETEIVDVEKNMTGKQCVKKEKHQKHSNQASDFDYVSDDYTCEMGNDSFETNTEERLVQDKKTNKWYRKTKSKLNNPVEIDMTLQKPKHKNSARKKVYPTESVVIDSPGDQDQSEYMDDGGLDIPDMTFDSSNFSKILQNLSRISNIQEESLDDVADIEIKTPCIVGSISSTPKIGSGKRRRYNPLNISVINTPQSTKLEQESVVETEHSERKNKPKKKQRRREMLIFTESESENEDIGNISRYSRQSTESVSFLDASLNKSNKSEKSWIMERKKTPRQKKATKSYKHKKRKEVSRLYGDQSESSDDTQKEHSQATPDESPVYIQSVSLVTPAINPSGKTTRSSVDPGSPIVTPYKYIGEDQTPEDDNIQDGSQDKFPQNMVVDTTNSEIGEDVELSVKEMLQHNMKLILGDSGFASGPSSTVRPSRSSLKRKYPDVEVSDDLESPSSQAESEGEGEKSVFIPKKLFKFDLLENTPQAPMSVYSEQTEVSDVDFTFQSGLSTCMAAFGADIQKQIQLKRQKLETLTGQTLKHTHKQFKQLWTEQQENQCSVMNDYEGKLMLELAGLEKDIARIVEAEKKTEEVFMFQMEVLKMNQESQKKRIENVKKVQKHFMDRAKSVNQYYENVNRSMKEKMKNDMLTLQRKLIEETQRQEFLNVKKGLQNLF